MTEEQETYDATEPVLTWADGPNATELSTERVQERAQRGEQRLAAMEYTLHRVDNQQSCDVTRFEEVEREAEEALRRLDAMQGLTEQQSPPTVTGSGVVDAAIALADAVDAWAGRVTVTSKQGKAMIRQANAFRAALAATDRELVEDS